MLRCNAQCYTGSGGARDACSARPSGVVEGGGGGGLDDLVGEMPSNWYPLLIVAVWAATPIVATLFFRPLLCPTPGSRRAARIDR
mgnify:CR=1